MTKQAKTSTDVLAALADKDELPIWHGGMTPSASSAWRVDGRLAFRKSDAVQIRGTHVRNETRRTVSDERVADVVDGAIDRATLEWDGEIRDVSNLYHHSIPARELRAKNGDGSALVDERYLVLARRLLEPDRITIQVNDHVHDDTIEHGFPAVVFWRDGHPVGILAQLIYRKERGRDA